MAIRVGIIGLGGFARTLHETVATLEEEGVCRLVCTCSQRGLDAPEAAQFELEARKVQVFSEYKEMLDACEIDVIVIPTPVPEHAPMHAECVKRGLYIYLEKPPTLSHEELLTMLDVEAGAQHTTHVGFNFVVEAQRQALKERLLGGEFGAVREAYMRSLQPRSSAYFQQWRGRLRMEGELVLDVCMGNAVAHWVHNMLQWCGEGEVLSWADIDSVQAELYRAHAIESADTVFASVTTTNGVRIPPPTTTHP
eukprot:COSAG04_NODE_4829_length_1876_cov_1.514350_2_plen_252_part_00